MSIRIAAGRVTENQTLPEPGTGIPLPSGNIMQIKHDSEALDDRFRIRFPEVFPMYLSKYCELDEAWQWWWFRQLIHSFTGYQHWDETKLSAEDLKFCMDAWHSLTGDWKGFCNNRGTWQYRDYVNDNNKPCCPGQEPLVCCGDIVNVLGGKVRLGGEDTYPVETLDGSKLPPPIEKVNRLRRPDLIGDATNVSGTILYDNVYRVDPWPQLDGKPVPVAWRTHGKEAEDFRKVQESKGRFFPAGAYSKDGVSYAVNYIRASRLKPVSGSVVPTPYI